MKHYGNVSKINGADVEPVDVIIGGSPCQDLSVAGKRAGIGGTRSGLFMEQIRIIREMREKDEAGGRSGRDVRPRFCVWENVPGALSSNGGEDFRIVLEEFCRVKDPTAAIPRPDKGRWNAAGEIVGNGYSVAWRVMDAQYWGVPQRRRRIALVADFADERAGEILFKREGLRGDPAKGEKAREGTPANAEGGAGRSRVHGPVGCDLYNGVITGDQAATLNANTGASANHAGPSVICKQEEPTPTEVYGVDCQGGKGAANYTEDIMPTLLSDSHGTPHAVAYSCDCRNATVDSDITCTLQAKPNGGTSVNCMPILICDARGNGDGLVCPTITGDHQDRITDYTAVVTCQETGFGWVRESDIAESIRTPVVGGAGVANLIVEKSNELPGSDRPVDG